MHGVTGRACVVLLALLLPSLLHAQHAAAAKGLGRIREADLRRDLAIHASDAYRGREAGTIDELRASTWLAQQMASIGVLPAGEDGTYFQWWNMRRNRIASTSVVRLDGDSTTERLWADLIVTAPTDARLDASDVVWAGDGSDSSVVVRGKVAVANIVAPPMPPRAGLSLAGWRYARLAIARQSRLLRDRGAAAVVLIADSIAESEWDYYASAASRGTYAVDLDLPQSRPLPSVPVLLARARLRPRLQGARTLSLDLRTESFAYPSVNVVGVLPGREAARGEVVLFSSHQDHDGVRHAVAGDSIWNGADDNGTVSVALLAIMRAWKAEPGRRGALFVFHGAEERGLLGSTFFGARPTVPADSIVAVLNADMIGRGPADSAALLGRFPPHRNSTALADLALAANELTGRFALDTLWDKVEHPEGWYFRSDHLPYARRGFPALMFSTLLHPDYHTPRDEPDTIDYVKLARMARWMYQTGKLVADRAPRVTVDAGFKLER